MKLRVTVTLEVETEDETSLFFVDWRKAVIDGTKDQQSPVVVKSEKMAIEPI